MNLKDLLVGPNSRSDHTFLCVPGIPLSAAGFSQNIILLWMWNDHHVVHIHLLHHSL